MKLLRLSAISLGLALGLFVAMSGLASAQPAQMAVQTTQTHAEMLPEHMAVAPGQSLWIALDLHIKPGWHTYWRTPGDSGFAPSIQWTLPPGITAGPIEWPVPQRIPIAGLMQYGYHDHVTLLTELKFDPSVAAGDATITADAMWPVCAEVCVPEDGAFTFPIKIDPAAKPEDTPAGAVIAAARAELPKPAPWPVKVTRAGDTLTFTAGPGIDAAIKTVNYFPYEDGLIVNMAPQTVHRSGQSLALNVQAEQKSEKITDGDGVLVVDDAAGHSTGYSFAAPVAWTGPADAAASMPLVLALVFAFAGGLILNAMPCVLPVLVMKALSFIKLGGASAQERRNDALAYTAGVLVAFTALVAVLLGLRAAGNAVGWAFQLQSPPFVAILAYIMLALGLNLSGVFVIGRTIGVGQSLAARAGISGAFFTGLLAVVVATPCTGPFMGAAVGFALAQPAFVSITVFEALALGFAFPYLVLAFVPQAAKILPRPGVWMERLRQVLAFPLYGAAAWMLWVLAQQVDSIGLALAFAGVVTVAFAGWLAGVSQSASAKGRRFSIGLAGLAAIAALALIATLGNRPMAQAHAGANADAAQAEPFSEARLAALRAEGRPVLVNFTAAWCLTCIVNERVALSQPAVADALKNHNVVYLKADWTNRNADISKALHALGREGVPAYVLYGKGAETPKILPQLLTPAIVTDAIGAL